MRTTLPLRLLAHNPSVENIKAKCLSYYHHLLLSYADLSEHFVLEMQYFSQAISSDYLKTNLLEHLYVSN